MLRKSRITAPVGEVIMPTVRGKAGSGEKREEQAQVNLHGFQQVFRQIRREGGVF